MILYLDTVNLGNRPTKYRVKEIEPRPNIRSDYRSSSSRCATSTNRSVIESWDYQFEVYCLGHGDLRSAQRAVDAIDTALLGTPIAFVRQVDNETVQASTVQYGYTRPINIPLQYGCDRIIAVELNLHIKSGLQSGMPLPTIPGVTLLADEDDPAACYFYFL